MQVASAHTAACRVQPSEFLLRRLHRDAVRPQVLARACHLVRRGRPDAADIFLQVRLRDAMAHQHAGRRGEFDRVRLQDENSAAHRDEAVHPMVALRGELEIFGLAAERPRVAVLPNLFQAPTVFQMVPRRQGVVQQERPAGWVPRAVAELPDAAQMAQLQALPEPQEQPPQGLPVSQQRVPGQMLEVDELVNDPANGRGDEHLSLRALARRGFPQDALPFPESRRAPPVSPQLEVPPFPAQRTALLPVAQA